MTRTIRLRPWQRAALDRFGDEPAPDFLAVATPGAGKTTFALVAARRALAAAPGRVIVVVPTAHLKIQWARAAAELDLHLEASWSPGQGALPSDVHGVVTTYQQVATSAAPIARLAKGAFVVLDEIHHAGDDRAWGESLREAFGEARHRLMLSGTPFRSDTRAIPFVTYHLDEAQPDFEYGYGEALAERRVVRPVYFPRTNGHMEWASTDGQVHSATFDDALDLVRCNQRLRTALSLEGQWLPEVLLAAHARLTEVRATHPDAAGLVIAIDQEHARGIAELMTQILRTVPVVATSDDPGASQAIADFAGSQRPWLVAVRMVSEGVDIPRLRVGVFATTTTTELFFRQAVGRFVRWLPGIGRQSSYVFIPDDPRLRAGAHGIAEARRHNLARRERAERSDALEGEFDEIEELVGSEEQLSLFTVISAVATEAVDADGDEGDEPFVIEDDPALLVDLGALPLPWTQHRGARASPTENSLGPSFAERKRSLRSANNGIARSLARATGWSHAKVNTELNRLTGLDRVTEASVAQLESRLRHGERWLDRAESKRGSPAGARLD